MVRGDDPAIAVFLTAAVAGNQVEAKKLLLGRPALARASIYTASILGEVDAVEALIQAGAKIPVNAAGTEEVRAVMRRYSAKQRFS